MDHDERLEIHLELCKRIYERMKRDGSWPWRTEDDSPNSDDLVELEDKADEV